MVAYLLKVDDSNIKRMLSRIRVITIKDDFSRRESGWNDDWMDGDVWWAHLLGRYGTENDNPKTDTFVIAQKNLFPTKRRHLKNSKTAVQSTADAKGIVTVEFPKNNLAPQQKQIMKK